MGTKIQKQKLQKIWETKLQKSRNKIYKKNLEIIFQKSRNKS
jgi:hypothetical protein